MIFIIGSRGRLGRAIFEQYPSERVVCVDRAVYEHWSAPDAVMSIADYFSASAYNGSVLYICSGLLDPRLSAEQLYNVNVLLPQNIISAVTPLGIKAITFGTAMESTLTSNPYVQSKLALSEFVGSVKSGDDLRPAHIRIHTLYGSGEPSHFMFLGQVLNSIRNGTAFEMTQGRQLREYHHVSDDAAAIKILVDRNVDGVVELSHGQPVSLRHLAESVFRSVGKVDLLRLGALPEPTEENFNHVFSRPASLEHMVFRDSVGSVVEYMNALSRA